MAKIKPRKVYDFTFECRPPCDPEPEFVRGFWTGEVDTWGKLTIVQVPSGPPYYVFRNEITDAEGAAKGGNDR